MSPWFMFAVAGLSEPGYSDKERGAMFVVLSLLALGGIWWFVRR